MPNLTRYRKTAAALIGSALTWAGVALIPDGHVNRAEWYALAVALATVAGVYGVPNSTDSSTDPQPVGDPYPGDSVTPPAYSDAVSPAGDAPTVSPAAPLPVVTA